MAKQKLVLKESQLREMVKQAIMENLNEAEMDEINGWGRSLKDAWKGFKQGWDQSRYDYYGNKVNPNQNNNSDYNAPANLNAQPDNQSTTGDNYDNGEADNTQPQASTRQTNIPDSNYTSSTTNTNYPSQETQTVEPRQGQPTQPAQDNQQQNNQPLVVQIQVTPDIREKAQAVSKYCEDTKDRYGNYKHFSTAIGDFIYNIAQQILNAK